MAEELSSSDVIETTGAAVYTIVESVEGMKKAYDIGKKVEEEEREKKRENIIIWVLSAILMVLPFAGSALVTFTGLSMIGRIAGIVSYQGGVAMSAYGLAKNEGNPVLAVFFSLC